MPRRYSMERRTAIVDETRQRIVDATVELHGEKGVMATSMQDIAARAGVALGTVYRHFPSLDELIPACGGRNMELNPPPTAEVFEGLQAGEERVDAFFSALYAHYEAAERPYFVAIAEASRIPALQSFAEEVASYVRSLVAQAIEPMEPGEQGLGVAQAMADFLTWLAFHRAGFTSQAAAKTAARAVIDALEQERSGA